MTINEPYMTSEEKTLIIHFLKKYKPKKVLEYGIGWSTYHFSNFDFIEEYYGVEHDENWIKNVRSMVDEKVKLIHCPLRLEGEKYAAKPCVDNYVIHNLGPFDFIFIDGDYRWQCLEYAAKNLTPNGYCMVHDSARKDMHRFFNHFKNHKILTDGELNSNNDWHQGLTILYNFDGAIL